MTKITSGGGFEEQHGEESSSPVGGRNGSPTESLAEALGFKSERGVTLSKFLS